MKTKMAIGLLLAGIAAQASAEFVGSFAPANWTQLQGDGAVNAFSADTLRFTSGNFGSASYTDVGISVAFDGRVSFDWTYSTQDDPSFDPFGVSVGSPGIQFTEISDSQGAALQSGTFSMLVAAGQVFAFTAWSIDGLGGAATTSISNFTFRPLPEEVPEPGTLALLAGALAAAALTRRRCALSPA